MTPHNAGERVEVASASTRFASKVAGAADPAKSWLGRLGDTAAAVQLATRVLPAGWRVLKRYPLRSSLVILALAWAAAYSFRAGSTSRYK